MPNLILEIHSSKLDSYADCNLRGLVELLPQAFKDAGFEVKETPQYITGNVGSAIHAGVADLHFQKDAAPVINLPHAGLQARYELEKLIEQNPGVLFTQNFPNLKTIYQHIDEYIEAYFHQVLPIRQAKLVEHKFIGNIADDVTYKTTLDLFTNTNILADLKSGAKITPAYMQMGMYLLLLKKSGYSPKGVVLDYMLRDNKAKNSGAITHTPIVYNHLECMAMTKTVLTNLINDFRIFAKTKKIDHIAVNPRSTNCNLFCPLYGTQTCGGWRKNG